MPFDHFQDDQKGLRQQRADCGLVNHLKGMAAEDSVISVYEGRGHQLLARRWRGKAGEIDLVFSGNATLIFVEVKASQNFAMAAAHLSQRQVAIIGRAIDEYLGEMPLGNLTDIRFDLAMVDGQGLVEILENVMAG
jgi:putative endonuclease